MKFQLLKDKVSIMDDARSIEELINKLNALQIVTDLYNEGDWKSDEIKNWISYQADLALAETDLYIFKGELL